jgi:predicted type IV restriction endonuclease
VLHLVLIAIFSALSSCSSHTSDDFREEGEKITRHLIKELQLIKSTEQLVIAAPKLKCLFNELVQTVIEAHHYRISHGVEFPELSKKNHLISEQLRMELNRILTIDGSWEILEKSQREALHRLNTYEKQQSKRKLKPNVPTQF